MKRSYSILAVLLLAVSCIDYGDRIQPEELCFKNRMCYVDAAGGECSVDVLSNLDYVVRPLGEEASWAELNFHSYSGDGVLKVSCARNDGFRRAVSFEISSPSTVFCDTLTVRQYGSEEVALAFGEVSHLIYNGQGGSNLPLDCNVDFDDLAFSVTYPEGESAWIGRYIYSDGSLVLQTEDNASDKQLRHARISIVYTDGWGEEFSTFISLTQLTSKNELGVRLTAEQIKSWSGDVFDGDYYFEGIVTSDRHSGNAGDNVQLTASTVDYTPSSCTVYVQNDEGTAGFAIMTATADDNIFEQWTRVKVNLKDCTLEKMSDPDRVTVHGVESGNLLSSESLGRENVTIRRLAMSELADSDVNTYVTLIDAMFAVRKGPLTPICENFTPVKRQNWITKFPVLLLGHDGASIYTLTNINCSYRRDGRRLPYGRGDMSGVIVHETYPRFSYEDAADFKHYGNIGRYQIRTTNRSDIAMPDDLSGNGIIAEYNYAVIGVDRYMDPSAGSRSGFIYSNAGYTYSATGTSVWFTQDFPYLGPVGNDDSGNLLKGNVSGCGIFDRNGNELLAAGTQESTVNPTGIGYVSNTSDPFCAWASSYWIKDDIFFAYLIHFSTAKQTSGQLSVQLSMMGNGTNGYGSPRYWHLQYYVGSDAPSDGSDQWTTVADSDFSLPDYCYVSSPKEYTTPGFKAMSFNLPDELLGKEKVWIAVRPTRDVAGSASGYQDGTIGCNSPSNRSAAVWMNYAAVRID